MLEFGNEIVPKLRATLENRVASKQGSLAQSIDFNVKIFGDTWTFQLTMDEHWKWVNKGRGKTRGGGSGIVRQKLGGGGGWVSAAGLKPKGGSKPWQKQMAKLYTKDRKRWNRQMAYLIAKKIHERGYEGNRFFTDTVTREVKKALVEKLKKATARGITVEINGITKGIEGRIK